MRTAPLCRHQTHEGALEATAAAGGAAAGAGAAAASSAAGRTSGFCSSGSLDACTAANRLLDCRCRNQWQYCVRDSVWRKLAVSTLCGHTPRGNGDGGSTWLPQTRRNSEITTHSPFGMRSGRPGRLQAGRGGSVRGVGRSPCVREPPHRQHRRSVSTSLPVRTLNAACIAVLWCAGSGVGAQRQTCFRRGAGPWECVK